MIIRQRFFAIGKLHFVLFKVDPGDLCAHDAGATQTAAQRRRDMGRLEATRSHFGQHGRKEKCVGFTNDGKTDARIIAEFFLETKRRGDPSEPAAEDNNTYFWP